MRDVAVVSYAQECVPGGDAHRNEVEILMPVVRAAVERSGIPRGEIGFTVSGSCDYLQGQPFAFVTALDAAGAWPPIAESHVEMDAAWALYEAWVRLQHGDIDSALVYGFGKSSLGSLPDVLAQQLDPYLVAPLAPDALALAALQARAMIDAGVCNERAMAEVAVRAARAPNGHASSVDDLLREKYVASPVRAHDVAPVTDGAAAVVLAADDLARRVCPRPAWIAGIDHRIEPQSLGMRDLAQSPSTALAAKHARVDPSSVELAELHAPFTHQEILLRRALELPDGVAVNPSGGAIASNPVMAAGLVRIGEAAQRLIDREASRAVAHATSGPCLQQNLVCLLEAR
jgi:acetyl-CoA acetyltransferase